MTRRRTAPPSQKAAPRQGASRRRRHKRGLFFDCVGGVVVTCSTLCCLCFYSFLCEALAPQLPQLMMGGLGSVAASDNICVHIAEVFVFFCFRCLVYVHSVK